MSHKNAAINILLLQLLLVFLFTFVCSILIQLVIIFEETSVYKIYQTTEEDRDEMRRTDKQTETDITSFNETDITSFNFMSFPVIYFGTCPYLAHTGFCIQTLELISRVHFQKRKKLTVGILDSCNDGGRDEDAVGAGVEDDEKVSYKYTLPL